MYRAVIAFALSLIAAAPAAGSDDEAIRLAATQLLGAQLPSGLLTYDFDFVTRAPVSKDSIARQAAGVAFFGEYYEASNDARARPAIEAGLAALERLSVPFSKGTLPSLIEASGLCRFRSVGSAFPPSWTASVCSTSDTAKGACRPWTAITQRPSRARPRWP